MSLTTVYLSIVCSLVCFAASAEVLDSKAFSFASYYGDHMVLQQAPGRALIWGYAGSTEEVVKLYINEKAYLTKSTPGPEVGVKIWEVLLEPVSGHGPFSITAHFGGKNITINDVLFGDVWVCSGQSNMAFTVGQLENGTAEAAAARRYNNIRVMAAAQVYSSSPFIDLQKIMQHWALPTKDSLIGPNFQYFSAVCWLFGKALYEELGYPIGLVESSWGGTPVEAWMSPLALAKCNMHNQRNGPGANSVLWNAMINPLLKMTVKGAIWYQGEANAGKPNTYNCTFPAMIDDWRQKFHDASRHQTDVVFPFGFVQLAGFKPDFTITNGFPDIRWHQTADYGYVPNDRMKKVFMAVAMDLPDFNSPFGSVHPRDKFDVVDRLALSGLAVAYDKSMHFLGPFPSSISLSQANNLIEIIYDKGLARLEIRDHHDWDFEIFCTTTYRWNPAPLMKYSTSSLMLKPLCQLNKISHVRYAWRESPCLFKKCLVYDNRTKLPSPPFIWKL